MSHQHEPTKNQFGAPNMNVIFKDSEIWPKEELPQVFLYNGILMGSNAQIPKRPLARVRVLIWR